MKIPETVVQASEADRRMYICVRYGENETLLCNPSCAIVNLLSSIKRRTGYGNTDMMLELSDESGLVKDLAHHKYDHATKFLSTHATYILLEKQLVPNGDLDVDMSTDTDGTATPVPPQYNYVPLLDNCSEHFPGYKLHVNAQTEKKKKTRKSKSPSPAGLRPTKTAKKPPLNRMSSKRR